jgi:hypothetical protein
MIAKKVVPPPYLVPCGALPNKLASQTQSSAFRTVAANVQPFLVDGERAHAHVRVAWQIFYDKTIASETAQKLELEHEQHDQKETVSVPEPEGGKKKSGAEQQHAIVVD